MGNSFAFNMTDSFAFCIPRTFGLGLLSFSTDLCVVITETFLVTIFIVPPCDALTNTIFAISRQAASVFEAALTELFISWLASLFSEQGVAIAIVAKVVWLKAIVVGASVLIVLVVALYVIASF